MEEPSRWLSRYSPSTLHIDVGSWVGSYERAESFTKGWGRYVRVVFLFLFRFLSSKRNVLDLINSFFSKMCRAHERPANCKIKNVEESIEREKSRRTAGAEPAECRGRNGGRAGRHKKLARPARLFPCEWALLSLHRNQRKKDVDVIKRSALNKTPNTTGRLYYSIPLDAW